MFRYINRVLSASRMLCRQCQHQMKNKPFITTVLLATGPVIQHSNVQKLQPPDPASLTHTDLIKNASVWTIDSASALLTQTTVALLDTLELYRDSLQRLMKLMELQLQVFGDEDREAKVWDSLMIVRAQVSQYKDQKQSLELVYHSALTALQAAAEAAHITGAEYAGATANERSHTASSHVDQATREVVEEEAALRQLEAKCIEELSRKAEEQKKQATADAADDTSGHPVTVEDVFEPNDGNDGGTDSGVHEDGDAG